MEQVKYIEDWYCSQCNGDREHGPGIKIVSLDNPSWSVTIDLLGTQLAELPFSEVRHNDVGQKYEDHQYWWACRKVATEFQGSGGPKQLSVILHIFDEWSPSGAK